MIKLRSFLIVVISLLGSITSIAQPNLLNAKTPSQIGIKSAAHKPFEYGYVDDRDVLMGKTVWEIINLSERINFPLYFPIDTVSIGSDRRSLFDVLIKAIRKGDITDVYSDSYFNTKQSYKDIQAKMSYYKITDGGNEQINTLGLGKKYEYINEIDPDTKVPYKLTSDDVEKLKKDGISEEYIITNDITAGDVSQYKIKGYWYFDNRESELKYRLLGICPVIPDVFTMESDENDTIDNFFWVFFPAARTILHESKSFNDKNSSVPISFDQILNSRRFNSVIYQEENIYGDRTIASYMKDNAQKQLLESERVKEKIRNFEENMWNY